MKLCCFFSIVLLSLTEDKRPALLACTNDDILLRYRRYGFEAVQPDFTVVWMICQCILDVVWLISTVVLIVKSQFQALIWDQCDHWHLKRKIL